MTREVEKIYTYRCNIPGCMNFSKHGATGFMGWMWKEGRLVYVQPTSPNAEWHSCLKCSDTIMTVRGKMIDTPPKDIGGMKERAKEMVSSFALREQT